MYLTRLIYSIMRYPIIGLWSTTVCQESRGDTDGRGLIECNCYRLSYSGVLFVSWISVI